jgi:hypothetical protein
MKKKVIILFLFLGAITVSAQKLSTKSGVLKFEASQDTFEEVVAENKNCSAILETSTGEIAVLTLIKGFRFKLALMEEHFNENYMESDQFPKATFKGKIEKFEYAALASTPKSFTIYGDLTIHGKVKKVSVTAKISKSENKILVVGGFDVKPSDFDIIIPKLVSKKIAERVQIVFNLPFTR